MKFMQNHKIYLTPLSPIHIGCGEDFEPTNYVIDGAMLFHFEPSNLHFNETQRTKLLNAVKQDLSAIQLFFLENKVQAVENSHYFANVAKGLAADYKQKFGKVANREKDGNKVFNTFAIERTSYSPFKNLPYIPGSSFKGALATALLEKEHQAKGNPKVGKNDHVKLLKEYIGDFQKSILRSVRFSDFMPLENTQSKIFYALNFKKKLGKTDGTGRAMALRRECIASGQYRAFQSELALLDNPQNKMAITDYFKVLNAFYLPIFREEAQLLIERNLVNANVLKTIENLLSQPNVALIRLGKNGADSKTYQADGMAQIKIMGARGTPPTFKDSSTTVWLAGTNQHQQNGLLPFGWALLECDPSADNTNLKAWCEQQPKSTFDRSAILAKREAKKAEQLRLQQEAEAKRQAELAAEEAQNALIASLSDNAKQIMAFVEKMKETRERQADNTGSALLKEAQALAETALAWSKADRQFTFENITLDLLKSKVDFKKKDTEKNVRKWLHKLVAE